jgi:hypothetical protein
VGRVWTFANLSPAGVRRIRRVFGTAIGAGASYWSERSNCRYATLIELTQVEPVREPIVTPRMYGRAWAALSAGVAAA